MILKDPGGLPSYQLGKVKETHFILPHLDKDIFFSLIKMTKTRWAYIYAESVNL